MQKNGILSATIWSAVQRFGGLAISFVSNMVLARLLSPDDFGVLGLVVVFVGIADTLVDGGLGNALIQKKDLSITDSRTVFTTNLAFSILLFSIVFIFAPLIERFTNVDNFAIYLRVQSVCILIKAFYVVNASTLIRTLRFKENAWVSLLAHAVATTVAIIMAYKGFGVWCLVAKAIIIDFSCCFFYALLSPFKYKISFDIASFKTLFGFGLPVALANILESLYSNIVSFLIGKRYSVKDLGYYNQAYSLEQIPVYSVSAVINQVFFPFFSRIQDDEQTLKAQFQDTVRTVSFLVYPCLAFLIFFAEPVITVVYSSKWLPSVPIFQVLCITGFFNSLYHLSRSTMKAIGKSKMLLYTQLIASILGLLTIGLCLRYSMTVFIWILVFNSLLSYSIVAISVGKCINYPMTEQIQDFFPSLLISLVIGFGLLKLSTIVQLHLCSIFLILIYGILFFVSYYGCHLVFNTKSYQICKILFLKRIKK